MELAYWFYLDYYAGDGSGLPNLSMRDFTHALFAHIPGLRKYSKRTDDIIATWKQFKFAVPTFGCILVGDRRLTGTMIQKPNRCKMKTERVLAFYGNKYALSLWVSLVNSNSVISSYATS